MNTVLYMDKGRVTIPKESRKRHGLADNAALIFHETKSGQLVFTPVKAKPEMSLLEHLRHFKGVEIPEIHFHSRPQT